MHPWNLEEFSELLCELSPENLHCDGEISVSEANRKYKKLMTQWRKLEKKLGREYSEGEIYDLLRTSDRIRSERREQ